MLQSEPLQTKDIVSAILSATALMVSLFTFELNYRFARRAAVLGRKPVLVFEYDGKVGWVLKNVGAGPALNTVVAQKQVGGDWFNPVRVPPLSKDGQMVLLWLGHGNTTGLGATYTDFERNVYTSTCGNDLSQVFEGARFGPWPEAKVGRHWNHPLYVE
jgi:hypothetical protein